MVSGAGAVVEGAAVAAGDGACVARGPDGATVAVGEAVGSALAAGAGDCAGNAVAAGVGETVAGSYVVAVTA